MSTTTTRPPYFPPWFPQDFRDVLPNTNAGNVCDYLSSDAEFAARWAATYAWIVNADGTPTDSFSQWICGIGCGNFTTEGTGTTTPTTTTTTTTTGAPLDQVTDLRVSKGYYGGDLIALVFTPVTGALTYSFYRNTVNNFATATLFSANRTVHSTDDLSNGVAPYFLDNVGEYLLLDTPPSATTKYYYWVVAINGLVSSAPSNVDNGWGQFQPPYNVSNMLLQAGFTDVVPGGVTKMRVVMRGSGAGGAGGDLLAGGGGGGGPAIVIGEFTVTAGWGIKALSSTGGNTTNAAHGTNGQDSGTLAFQIDDGGGYVTQMSTTAAGGGKYDAGGAGAGGTAGSGDPNAGGITVNPELIAGKAGLPAASCVGGKSGYWFGERRFVETGLGSPAGTGGIGNPGAGSSCTNGNSALLSLAVGQFGSRGACYIEFGA